MTLLFRTDKRTLEVDVGGSKKTFKRGYPAEVSFDFVADAPVTAIGLRDYDYYAPSTLEFQSLKLSPVEESGDDQTKD